MLFDQIMADILKRKDTSPLLVDTSPILPILADADSPIRHFLVQDPDQLSEVKLRETKIEATE